MRDTEPPFGVALALLRTAAQLTQRDLAALAGTSSRVISAYENAGKPLKRAKLERLVAALGYGPEAVEAALLFLEAHPPAHSRAAGVENEIARAIRHAAAAVGWAAAQLTRTELARFVAEAEARQARFEAEHCWRRLASFSWRERRVLVDGARKYHTWAVAERLCTASVAAAPSSATAARELAFLGLRAARRLVGDPDFRSAVEGYCWAHVANSQRVGGNLLRADLLFARASRLWEARPADPFPLSPSRLDDLEASLRRDQRRFAEALLLHERALDRAQPGSEAARLLLNRSATLEQMGDREGAIAALERAAPQIDGAGEPRLLCVLRFNLAVILDQAGRHEDAAALLPDIRDLAVRQRNDLDLVRLLWLEGRIAGHLGREQEAVAAMLQARDEFAHRNLDYDSALISLELAVLHLEQGRTAEVRALTRQVGPIFRAKRVAREALGALRLFCAAAEREAAPLDLARRLVAYFERARANPSLRFEGME